MSAIAMVSRFIMIEPKYSKSEPAIFISVGVLRRQLLQQRLRLFQIARVEPFREPAVNRSSSSRACCTLPWSRQRRARLIAARSSQDLACCWRATARARSKYLPPSHVRLLAT